MGTSQRLLHFFSRTLPGCVHDLGSQFSAHSPVCAHVSEGVVSKRHKDKSDVGIAVIAVRIDLMPCWGILTHRIDDPLLPL